MRIFYSLLILAAISFGGRTVAQEKNANVPPGLDEYIGQVMKTFDVPGMSVAIVKDGKVVMAKGFGVRQAGKEEPV
ncbi:MAG: beta-lactamase family protein, partial [Bacteroidetes bacterium]|nr:beta-lactamase family protein [Bacteroidota bacterium]